MAISTTRGRLAGTFWLSHVQSTAYTPSVSVWWTKSKQINFAKSENYSDSFGGFSRHGPIMLANFSQRFVLSDFGVKFIRDSRGNFKL